jgi:hypothetical protein
MPALLTRPTLDPDVLGPLLVAEIEQYLKTVAPAARPTWAAPTLLARHGQHLVPWHYPHPAPHLTIGQRLRGHQPVVDVTVQDHLHLMSAYIHRHGWTQGALWTPDGKVCLLGAHYAVLTAGYGTPTTAWRARIRIGNALGYAGHPMPVDDWNDAPGRTLHDIHQLLNTAAND